LQMLQVGAQNQNTVGLPTAAAPSKVPPPTSGAVNCSASGTTAGSEIVDSPLVLSLRAGAVVSSVVVSVDGACVVGASVDPAVAPAATSGSVSAAVESASELHAVADSRSTQAPTAAPRRVVLGG